MHLIFSGYCLSEATVEVLPRLFKIKYESGTLEELLYVDMPREYQNSSGQIVLDYAKAIQESVFEQLRVVREGQLRIVFSSDLKVTKKVFSTVALFDICSASYPLQLLFPPNSDMLLGILCSASRRAHSSKTVDSSGNLLNNFHFLSRILSRCLFLIITSVGWTIFEPSPVLFCH